MLEDLENLFFHSGVLALGCGIFLVAGSLVKKGRGFFKSGVTAMLFGDVCFAAAIVFPKKIYNVMSSYGIEELPADPRLLGLLSGAVLVLLAALVFIRKKHLEPVMDDESGMSFEEKKQAWQKDKLNRTFLKNAGKKADPKLFAGVIKQTSAPSDTEKAGQNKPYYQDPS